MSFILTKIVLIIAGVVVMTLSESGLVWFAGLSLMLYGTASWIEAYRPLRTEPY